MDQYNRILWRTHDKKNSLLLHLRSHHIDIARRWHHIQNVLSIVPIVVLILMYGCYYFFDIKSLDVADLRSVTVGISLFFTLMTALMGFKIKKEKELSEKYRELYDCRVFEIPPDEFLVDLAEVDVDQKELEKRCFDMKLERPFWKYSVWYEEIFSDSRACNIITCEVQNISFSRDLYKYMEDVYRKYLIAFVASTAVICVVFGVLEGIFSIVPIIAAVMPKLFLLYKTIQKSNRIWNEHQEVMDVLMDEKDRFREANDLDLRMIQSHMFRSRADDIFVPRKTYRNFVRSMHDHSNYWYEFAELYHKGLNLRAPSNADEVMVVGKNYNCDKEGDYMMLSEMQMRIRGIMKEIHEIFTSADPPIRYYVDGGTLLDIKRPEHPVFWDDDMDITIMSEDLERAKTILAEKLSDDYIIQDESDKYFIPYACKFRVRDKRTTTEEMDNSIYPHFSEDKKGVFIDVYAIISPLADANKEARYRKTMKGIYQKMKSVEGRIYINTPPESYTDDIPEERTRVLEKDLAHYVELKSKFLDIEKRYISETKRNDDLRITLPSYSCEDFDVPSYKKEDVVSDKYETVEWNGIELNVPNNPEGVLNAFYGDGWKEPKFNTITALKHIYTCDKK